MKKLLSYLVVILVLISFSSCEELIGLATGNELSEEEVSEALKLALTIGADSATTSLSKLDGYYNGSSANALIQLPEDLESVRSQINSDSILAYQSKTMGLDEQFDIVILSLNRAAEDAASESDSFLNESISSLTIDNAFSVLRGAVQDAGIFNADVATAATQFYINNTYANLIGSYAPIVSNSLNANLEGEESANEATDKLTDLYSTFLTIDDVQEILTNLNMTLPETLESDYDAHTTEYALNALLIETSKVEKSIRSHPDDYDSEVIQKVFGWAEDNF